MRAGNSQRVLSLEEEYPMYLALYESQLWCRSDRVL